MNIRIRKLHKSYPGTVVFRDLNLDLNSGEVCCLLGPSGCGKSTLLHLLAGSATADSGSVEPETAGRVSYLFQESRLLPWLTVLDNAAYLMDRSRSRAARRLRAGELLARVGLEGYEMHYPRELSGGMSRRVALARMLGKDARLLLLDEPFSSLDPDLKFRMVELTRSVLSDEKRTALCVTHDVSVAEKLGGRILTMVREDGATSVSA